MSKADHLAKHYGGYDRMMAIKRTPCCVCGTVPSENHHTKGPAHHRPWQSVVPLCRKHHREYHDQGRHTFAARYDIDLEAVAKRLAEEIKP